MSDDGMTVKPVGAPPTPVQAAAPAAQAHAKPKQPPSLEVRSNRTREQYEEQVRKGKEYIAAGDIYQVVL